MPFYHCFGMVMGNLGCTTHGATMVIPADAFDPCDVLEAVQAERCTALYGVPTMFIAELGVAGFDRLDLSSLRTGVMAGSPCPVEVMKACIDRMHMGEVTICYGMTETSPVSTQTLPDDSIAPPHRDRRPRASARRGAIADPRPATVERGATGELCTRGYWVMLGYWDDPEQTAEAIDADGWMHTGDLAAMDDDGYLNIVGRIKDMVIRGGENVYPREVEEFLYGHPEIIDVQVVGVPDERYGEELMAWVKLRAGADAGRGGACATYCRGQIAHFKVPRYVRFVDEFPMTVTGKVQKYLMREQALAELTPTPDRFPQAKSSVYARFAAQNRRAAPPPVALMTTGSTGSVRGRVPFRRPGSPSTGNDRRRIRARRARRCLQLRRRRVDEQCGDDCCTGHDRRRRRSDERNPGRRRVEHDRRRLRLDRPADRRCQRLVRRHRSRHPAGSDDPPTLRRGAGYRMLDRHHDGTATAHHRAGRHRVQHHGRGGDHHRGRGVGLRTGRHAGGPEFSAPIDASWVYKLLRHGTLIGITDGQYWATAERVAGDSVEFQLGQAFFDDACRDVCHGAQLGARTASTSSRSPPARSR